MVYKHTVGMLSQSFTDCTNQLMLYFDSSLRQCEQKLGKAQCTFTRKRKMKISPQREKKTGISFPIYLVVHSRIHLVQSVEGKQVTLGTSLLLLLSSIATNTGTRSYLRRARIPTLALTVSPITVGSHLPHYDDAQLSLSAPLHLH